MFADKTDDPCGLLFVAFMAIFLAWMSYGEKIKESQIQR